MKAIQQLLHEVDWGALDILVLDLPPGTGDTQLTITQQVILDGEFLFIFLPWNDSNSAFPPLKPSPLPTQKGVARLTQSCTIGSVIVTTPHTLATKDAIKGINMFKTVDVNILGLVQNMSLFTCPHCHGETNVFGSKERVEKLCTEHRMDFLGDIPLHPSIGDDGERGKPTVASEPSSTRASAFLQIAQTISSKVGL